LGVGRSEDASDAAAEIGGAREVWLGFGLAFDARAVEGEDSGQRGDCAQSFGGALGREGYGVLEVEGRGHRRIVDSRLLDPFMSLPHNHFFVKIKKQTSLAVFSS
jgi:hypothetical protein